MGPWLLLLLGGGGGPPSFTPWGATLRRQLSPSDWDGTATARLEVHGRTDNGLKAFQARLYNETAAAVVAGSEVSTFATTVTRLRSGAFSLAAGDNVYRIEFGGVPLATYRMHDGALIVDVT